MNRITRIATALVIVSCASALAAAPSAKQILDTTGVKGGLVVHLGCGDGKLTAALRANESYLVHGLDADADNVEAARKHIQSLGLYGKVSVEQWSQKHLPYTDNLVNLLVSEDLGPGAPGIAEVMRVLAPNGVAYVKKDGKWSKTVKPRPKEIDDWTHYLHDASNNAVANDTVVGPPRHIRWVAGPLYCRSHEIDTSVCALVSARGRMFYILDEGLTGITDYRLPEKWALVARDAFSGVQLWKRPVPRWGWPQWKKAELAGKDWTGIRSQRTRSPVVVPRRLVAAGERVYVTLGYKAPLTAIDAATGNIVHTYEGTSGTDEILHTDGVLVLSVRPPQSAQAKDAASAAKDAKAAAKKRRRGSAPAKGSPTVIMAIKADSGREIWKTPPVRVLQMTLAARDGRVFYHTGDALVCVDLKSGKQQWRTPNRTARSSLWGSNHTMLACEGAVLICVPGKIEAFSAKTGKKLWTGKGGRRGCSNPPDMFVADGLVWNSFSPNGYDPMTGKVKRKVNMPPCLITVGHHIRCYRGKATERYILSSKRGIEFMDIKGTDHMKCDWLRGACKYGFMPCNGLLYMPPDQCFCYPGAKLPGFTALAPRRKAKAAKSDTPRLTRGPAYGQIGNRKSEIGSGDDWPTFRHDAKRSGSTASAVPAKPRRIWQVDLGGRITQPVVAGGKLFVASVDTHTVHALDSAGGKALWRYTAGGRVDSPPTIWRGRVLFGSADGYVYCLRASDGKEAWRFRAAVEERRVADFDQLASAWPVHGSVLVRDGIAYFAAGRSSYLDGGIYVYGLDARTGKKLHEAQVEGPYPDVSKDPGRPFDMEGALVDVMVAEGKFIHMRQIMFDAKLTRQETPRLTKMGDKKVGRHLFATGGLLDGSGWNRTFWMYTERWPGFYIANQASKTGQMLVFDDANTYGVKCFTRRNRHSPMFFPGRKGYLLFADDNENEPGLAGSTGKPKPIKWLPDVNRAVGWTVTSPAVDKDKGTGFTRSRPAKWAVWVPIRIRAMVLAKDTLFIAGPPDVLDPKDPMAAFEGRKGGLLWAVSASDGKKLAEHKLESPPVFDGMIAANGKLFLSLRNGRLECWADK